MWQYVVENHDAASCWPASNHVWSCLRNYESKRRHQVVRRSHGVHIDAQDEEMPNKR